MFKAFISGPSDTEPSTKRGAKPGEVEVIADKAARIATNAKNHQNKAKDESVETTPAKIVGKSNPFKSTLKANEIKLLTECVNEANMFTTTVSTKILTDFFNCKLDGVLKVNNTRLLAYLMMQLSCYNYIVYEWQSVIANNKLILKKIKGEPLTRTDLSSATDQAKNIYPKGYEIIDKYIKQLQKG